MEMLENRPLGELAHGDSAGVTRVLSRDGDSPVLPDLLEQIPRDEDIVTSCVIMRPLLEPLRALALPVLEGVNGRSALRG